MHVVTPGNGEQERFLHIGLERDKLFAALWAGARRIGNESADDIALLNKLAYWCNANPSAMIQAFLSSPYHAQKDEYHKKKCQRTDYLPRTAKNACDTVYSTAAADYERWQQSQKRSHARQ
jgi:putative DNA primase/helicase